MLWSESNGFWTDYSYDKRKKVCLNTVEIIKCPVIRVSVFLFVTYHTSFYSRYRASDCLAFAYLMYLPSLGQYGAGPDDTPVPFCHAAIANSLS